MKIAICDDYKEDRALVRKLISAELLLLNQTAEFKEYHSGIDLLFDWEHNGAQADLIFLDIYMPEMTGLEIAKHLRQLNVDIPIVFLTATPDFALESYDVAAFCYLLKPVTADRLSAVMQRFIKLIRPQTIHLHGKLIKTQDIIYVQSQNKKVAVHLIDNQTLMFYGKISEIENQLTEPNFLRCHQSYLVNMNYISHIENNAFHLTTKDVVCIRTKELVHIRKIYFDYMITC